MAEPVNELRAEAAQHRQEAETAEEATQWQEAVRAYEACLSIVAQSPDGAGQDEAALLTSMGRCYWNLSEARTAWRTLRRAISLYQQREDGVGQARATVEVLRIWGPPDRHRVMAEEALAALGGADPYLQARLLLTLRWNGDDAAKSYDQAIALAEEHGFEDILASRIQDQGWQAMSDGKIDDAVALFQNAHETYARLRVHEPAAGSLRGAGYNLIEMGRLDQGFDLAEKSFEYAANVHLIFTAQLALLDMVGVTYARGEFERCEELLARSPGDSDFRADLYRMWIAEERGDMDGALRLIVNPDRGGKAPTAVGQIHAAGAGILYRAGNHGAAKQALSEWANVERPDTEDLWMEATALSECLVELGDDALVRKVYDAFESRSERVKSPARFSTLQGRSPAPVLGGVCHKLGLLDEADRHYQNGLTWCERERCLRDAELCRAGLNEVRSQRAATP